MNFHKARSSKNGGMFEVNSPEKLRQVREKDLPQQVDHMQVPNGTGPGVWKSKRHLSACYTVENVLWKPLISRLKVEFGKKITVWYKM